MELRVDGVGGCVAGLGTAVGEEVDGCSGGGHCGDGKLGPLKEVAGSKDLERICREICGAGESGFDTIMCSEPKGRQVDYRG